MSAQWACLTHVGAVRAQNQDAVVGQPPIFAVADGMGGHAAGDIASQITVRHLAAFAGASAVDVDSPLAACRAANAEILFRSRTEPDLAGMGTTVAGIALSRTGTGEALLVFNAGDSRVYVANRSGLVQITTDHSLVAEMVAAEEITEAQARAHPQRNVVTRGLGLGDEVVIDTWLLESDLGQQRFLVCSDGLTNEVEDGELEALLQAPTTVEACAAKLLELALARGARDNVSLIVLDVNRPETGSAWVDGDTLPREQATADDSAAAFPLISGVPPFPSGPLT